MTKCVESLRTGRWAQDQYDFRVYLDVDGSVLELVGDYDALGADDRALLPCPELRSSG